MNQPFDGTIGWEEYWTSSLDVSTDEADASAELLVEPFLRFLEWADAPGSYGDIGCFGGTLVDAVADQYPETSIIGYDALESVIELNPEQQREPMTTAYDLSALICLSSNPTARSMS
jgi:2-polyprenyl-3-methyl-5-hydroxy-6-metoxy-1,4-benzoquinol methylase